MKIIRLAKDYLDWMFFPSRFIFPYRSEDKQLRIPGWEVVELVSEQKKLKTIAKATGKKYLGGKGNEFLATLFGSSSVFTIDGEVHRDTRRLIATQLTREKIKSNIPHIQHSVRIELDSVSDIKSVNVGLLARRITMRSVLQPILGTDSEDTFETLFRHFEDCTGFIANIVSYNKRFWGDGKNKPFSINAMATRRVKKIDATIFSLIGNRKAQAKSENNSLLDELIDAQKQHGYSDEFIRDNLVSTIAAGYDTSGSAITWMLYWLSKPNEFQSLLGRAGTKDREKYIDSFISESLRYCPPLEILPRWIVPEERTIEHDNKTATLACPCPHLVHHDSEIYENPEKFIADRFVDRKFTATEYFPFGAASRICLGSGLANAILKSVLEELIDRKQLFQFRKNHFSPVRRNISIWPGAFNRGKLIEFQQS